MYGVDLVDERLDLAKKMGASQVIHSGKVSCGIFIIHFRSVFSFSIMELDEVSCDKSC